MNALQTVALAALVIGILALIYGIYQKVRAGRVADAPLVRTADAAHRGTSVAGPRGAISVEGNVHCPQPLMAPVSGTPCLFYELTVTATWKDGDSEKSKELQKEKRAADFFLDDGSGPVRIDANQGGDFEPEQKRSQSQKTGLLGGITGQDLMFGNFRLSTGALSLGTKYDVEEKAVPLSPKMYVCGKAIEGGVVGSPNWRQMIMSNKSRAEILGAATQGAKMFLIGGGAAMAIGVGLAVAASFMKGDEPKTASTDSTTTVTETAPVEASTAVATATANAAVRPASLPGAHGTGSKGASATGATTGAKGAAPTAAGTGAAAATGAAATPTGKPSTSAAAPPAKTTAPPPAGKPATPPAKPGATPPAKPKK